ncbi:DUF1772 domain-containing protein [Paeniglutamicibacter terrestris]|uniref:DUF1772 domain-containing protein n=1 Tax=Paeniglutamicibacter terrestris TaxID=2723403 RepID=A0ABX1G974_9MICC|nr:anthrone oxygenase family protein [Paeniglutamicibacter terrestris]NKG22579.1 DUF1772 domain-containing protein [Paeniglutamicibacter terrestris]
MNDVSLITLTIITAACTAIAGGVYFSFAALVLPALEKIPSREAVTAMRWINVAAVRWPFMSIFFGSMLTSVVLVGMEMAAGNWVPAAMARIVGSVLGIAAFGITVVGNVPLNNQLASDRGSETAADTWTSFAVPWGRLNHARWICAVVSAAVLSFSLVI